MVGTSLRKSFPRKGRPEKLAVRNITFHVREGEVFGLLGPNGAGKSTLLNMVIAEHAPSAGKVGSDVCKWWCTHIDTVWGKYLSWSLCTSTLYTLSDWLILSLHKFDFL